ncbi:nucleoside recognition domain-containing protein [Paraliobacillus ryukyuensis]|uniref:nucleoside recognition domain-containing protein n=1 Tax=Paraliobacillus ryukyuensis TaxID=200904 RepID=UPI0009A6A92B|nr:nucleoside recognition domain-containing protein [Paraliobacillus ryukyuensis]
MKQTLIRGAKQGLQVTWTLSKVIFPITVIITILQYTPVFDWLIRIITPIMNSFGLSGEAAIPLVLGNSLNLYAGIAAIVSFDFTVKEVFIMAVMLSFSHNLFIESSVATRVGIRWPIIVGIRITLAILSALLINYFWDGGKSLAQYGLLTNHAQSPEGVVAITLEGFQTALISILQLAAIVLPLMIVLQFFRELGWMDKISNVVAPFTRLMGMEKNASMTLVTGLTIGLAYGVGVMVQAVQQDGVAKKDMYLAFIFLVSCHAVVEDTLVFLPLGIPVWPLLLIRLTTAIVMTSAIGYFWNKSNKRNRKEETEHEYTYNSI